MIEASRGESAALVVADLVLIPVAFAAAYLLRFGYGLFEVTAADPATLRGYGEALALVLAVFGAVFASRGLLTQIPARGIDVLERTLAGVHLASLVVLATSFFQREVSYSRAVYLLTWVLCLAVLPLPRLYLMGRRRRRYRRGLGLQPVLIVGSSVRAQELAERLATHRRYGLAVRGLLTPLHPQEEAETTTEHVPCLGSLEELERVAAELKPSGVLVGSTLERLELFGLLERCEQLKLTPYLVPPLYDLFVTPGDLKELFGVPFIGIREQQHERLSRTLKRAFDLSVGLVLCLACLPLLLVLGLLIRRDGGSAFFRQRRVGEGGVSFLMWKLRTMVPDAEARLEQLVDLGALEQPVYKLQDDPRVTPLGAFLRRWSLDELPQLFNVLSGDMSLVGPRPEVHAVVEHYNAHHRRRLKAKPGLTGLQQIEARATANLDERVALDVYYTRRRSFVFDLWILVRTPWAVLHGRGAR